MLKKASDKCKWQLLHIINKSWTEGKLPDEWKLGTIIPLLKQKKPPHDPGSYRPISLTSVVCKVMESMIATRLTSHLENNNLLAPTQSGFRKNRSTLDQIVRLQTAIIKAKMEHRDLLCIFLDLEKAFDLMWTKGVLLQLTKFKIEGRILAWVQDFLKDRKIQVRVGSDLSDIKFVDNGSPPRAVFLVRSCSTFLLTRSMMHWGIFSVSYPSMLTTLRSGNLDVVSLIWCTSCKRS